MNRGGHRRGAAVEGRAVALAVALGIAAACGGGGAVAVGDAGPGADTAPGDALGVAPDGAPDGRGADASVDASVDAAVPDASPPDAPCVPAVDDGSANPFGIRLERVTATMPVLPGGRRAPDPWAFGSGAAMDDLDGDGDLDVVVARAHVPGGIRPGGPSTILWNDGPTPELVEFRRDAAVEALTSLRVCHGAGTADIDQDGDVDVAIACEGADLLLENDGAGGFTDVAVDRGVEGPAGDKSSAPIFADVNQDGLIDLYVLAFAVDYPPTPQALVQNRLYLGRGEGRFEDVSLRASAGGYGASHAALVANLDADPALEIFVANDRFAAGGSGGSVVIQGDAFMDPTGFDAEGIPSYIDRGNEHGLSNQQSSMGIALADLNEDGFDDLYVADLGPNHVWLWYPAAATYLDDFGALGLDLGASSIGGWYISWSVVAYDLDRDGRIELSVTTGDIGEPYACTGLVQRDFLFRRTPAGTYQDITAVSGLPAHEACASATEPLTGRATVGGDLDGDGDDDAVLTPYIEDFAFYRNDTPRCGRTSLRVRPVGRASTREAAATRLVVELADGRTIVRTLVGGGETYSQGERILEVGLDGAGPDGVVEARLEWASGFVQRVDLMPAFASTIEGGATWTIVEPRWLTVSARDVAAGASTEIIYERLDPTGMPRGAMAAGGAVTASTQTRLAGGAEIVAPAPVADLGDGRYRVTIAHPGTSGSVRVSLMDPDVSIRIAPVIRFQ